MKLLCLSNGHGEDAIAVRILHALRSQSSHPKLAALPLVGEGTAYLKHDIPILGPVKSMPSGGFIYMDGRQLVRDMRGGLLQLTRAQINVVRAWGQSGGQILAVGDIVPLLFAWFSGAPYAFVGTAKSEYYLRDEEGLLPRCAWFERLESWSGSVYLPWERWLMRRPQCKAVFPRDRLTTEILQQWPIPAVDLGNPMMDDLEPTQPPFRHPAVAPNTDMLPLTVLLLPGSRPPEAYENWQQLVQVLKEVRHAIHPRRLLFLGAIAPTLDLGALRQILLSHQWQPSNAAALWTQGTAALVLTQTAFETCLHQADVAIAMAGTATEQFVGLGKPAIVIPGRGPQFTPAFAEAQTRLLGASALIARSPNQVGKTLTRLLQNPDHLQLIATNGKRRMGEPGAAQRIAHCLIERLSPQS